MNKFSDVFKEAACVEFYQKYRPEWSHEIIQSFLADSTGQSEKEIYTLNLAVDIGCGTGQSTRPLSSYFKKVIGVDVSEAQLENAKKSQNPCNVEYRTGSAENIPLSDECTDVVVGACVLHWIFTEDMCMETDRVLKPGGWFIFYGCHSSDLKIEFRDKTIDVNPVRECYKNLVYTLYGSIIRSLIGVVDKEFYAPIAHYADIKCNKEYMDYTLQTNVTGLIGLIKSHTGYWMYLKNHPDCTDPVDKLQNKIMAIVNQDLPPEEIMLTLTFPLWMRCGRKLNKETK